ncbi:MAG: hypothetical protein JWO46_59 [Nocardioidaceae bacterium]|nr:hypothetical protein [Nocardioidaceae bacterium]
MTPAVVIIPMHGVGGAKDLPIPAPLAIAAATAALVVSFSVLILAWRQPRYDAKTQGRPLPEGLARFVDSRGLRAALRVLGLLVAAYLTWPAVAGPDVVTNPVFGSFYVLLWVGIVPASLLVGPAFKLVSPMRTLNIVLARATGGDPAKGVLRYPAWLGYWPAALGLFAFVWQELVNQESTLLGSVRFWMGAYVAIMLIGSAIFGETFFTRADPFEVYSTLVGRLAPIGRRGDGTLVFRTPLTGLDGVVVAPGLVAVMSVLFGSTAFDSYKDKLTWTDFVDRQSIPVELTNTLALIAFPLIVAVTFSLAAMATGTAATGGGGTKVPRRDLPGLLVHSVVPIVVGYMTAHYLSYFVEQGQTTLIQLSDPMVNGRNYLGTANWSVDYWLSQHPSFLADAKVLAIVLGHITGAVAAHDRVLRLLPKKHQVTGQLGMLVVMVAYTATGLYLLFGA